MTRYEFQFCAREERGTIDDRPLIHADSLQDACLQLDEHYRNGRGDYIAIACYKRGDMLWPEDFSVDPLPERIRNDT